MKFKLYIDNQEEVVEVHSHSKNELTDQIEQLVNNSNLVINGVNIYGYLEDDIVLLNINNIDRFYVDDNRVIARVYNKSYQIKYRIYQLEEYLKDSFIKINQSCLVNKRKIKRFNTSWSGSLLVELSNGDIDYVSRRQLKHVKERMGL